MSNEDLPPNAELASAYLDGELDPTQRAAAAADPDVAAAIDSFARVRAAIGEVDPPSTGTKNAALAAALAEFDAVHGANSAAGAGSAPAAEIVSLQSRRQRTFRVLTGVAAAAVIAVVGIAALSSTRGQDNDLASSATDLNVAAPAASPELKSATESAAGAAAAATIAASETAAPTAVLPIIDTTKALQEFAASIDAGTSLPLAPTTGSAAPAADQAATAGVNAALP
jgi:hypothetical protein